MPNASALMPRVNVLMPSTGLLMFSMDQLHVALDSRLQMFVATMDNGKKEDMKKEDDEHVGHDVGRMVRIRMPPMKKRRVEAPAPLHKHSSPPSKIFLIIFPSNENLVNFACFFNIR